MVDYIKLQRLLHLLMLLIRHDGIDKKSITKETGISDRNIYRYLEVIEAVGLEVERPKRGVFSISSGGHKMIDPEDLISFSFEEASYIKQALYAMPYKHPTIRELMAKIGVLTDSPSIAAEFVNAKDAQNLRVIIQAMREEKQVIFKDYHSANSGKVSDRLVEPYKLGPQGMVVHAYEIVSDTCKVFKISRMSKAFKRKGKWVFRELHKEVQPDAFGMTGDDQFTIGLKLKTRAYHLLKEEFPLTRDKIFKKNGEIYHYNDTVNALEGVGRFVLGLPGEVEVIEGDELKAYILKKIQLRL